MSCGQFTRNLEYYLNDYLARGGPAPAHAAACRHCARRWRTALASQALLASLRPSEPSPAPEDAYFFARLQTRIAHLQREQSLRWNQRFAAQLGAARRDLALAGAVLAITLGSFCFGLHRTESPDISEAIALDVPHVHVHHPSQDHGPAARDVLLSLLNR